MTYNKFRNIGAARGICQSRECERIFAGKKYFRCKFGNIFGTHFKEKATLLKLMHQKQNSYCF